MSSVLMHVEVVIRENYKEEGSLTKTLGTGASVVWTHKSVWAALDALAEVQKLTASGLARKAGLDPTAFNPSKRHGADGRPRWPSTESISKVLSATGVNLREFLSLIDRDEIGNGAVPFGAAEGLDLHPAAFPKRSFPLLGLAQAGVGGFFDDGGFPVGEGWDQVSLPAPEDGTYALEITGDSMLPLYRDGDTILISPSQQVRRGDRVVVKTVEGEVMAKILKRRTDRIIELQSNNVEHPDRVLDLKDIAWMARIVWASQ
ncbi:Phage repressor protein C, contains Cro/C1-type HTH and peptisase s24 domains [Faunimonas pinastri]|uniref:Phage repressor protein C, contains Cro/C1-type HTH and peptisase s24 domains n=1 Tax=Faunimonas pinastri TaxID=1855383 RepID=A0A1H9HNH5_9HYPH|nr:Phage repressor protein C, contains Cro/C1-type HTH and peptisase s24 domains [Faunimonas pinastri]